MKENLFYVGIKDTLAIRRSLLYSSKDIIDSLRMYESFKKAKERRHLLNSQFTDVLEEITVLIAKLKSFLPKTSLKAAGAEAQKIGSGQIDVLEEELKRVEERLRELE